jgi:hypothetical protein
MRAGMGGGRSVGWADRETVAMRMAVVASEAWRKGRGAKIASRVIIRRDGMVVGWLGARQTGVLTGGSVTAVFTGDIQIEKNGAKERKGKERNPRPNKASCSAGHDEDKITPLTSLLLQ